MSRSAVFLDIKKVFDRVWYLDLLHKLPTLKISISLIKLISSFLSQRKHRVSVDGEMSTARDISAIMLGPVLHIVQSIYK
jgi:hypothetical protein